jgi:hypothetical protein
MGARPPGRRSLARGVPEHRLRGSDAAYANVVDQKARPCMERAPMPALDPSRCERNLHVCAEEDVTLLESQVRCYEAVGTCEAARKDSFLQVLSHCTGLGRSGGEGLGGVSFTMPRGPAARRG